MQTQEIARRFPASLGYRSRADVPAIVDLTSSALAAHSARQLTTARLAEIMGDLSAYQDTGHWNSLRPAQRACLMADVMDHEHALVRIEAAQRRSRR